MKRGQADMIEWFPRLLMLVVAVIVIVMLVRFFAYRDVDASELHRASYAYRLYYDDDLLAYQDPVTRRAYPGTIDLTRLTPTTFDEVYGLTGRISSKDGRISSKVTIACTPAFEGGGGSFGGAGASGSFDGPVPEGSGESERGTVLYHDRATYEQYLGFALYGTLGPGGATIEEHVFPVTIYDGQNRCAGTLNISVVRPNS